MARGKNNTKYGGFFFIAIVLSFVFFSNGILDRKRVQTYMKNEEASLKLNKNVVKIIKSEGGDVVDCVDIYKQPAFDHPLLKNHVLQLKPSYPSRKRRENFGEAQEVFEAWLEHVECPEGTIPILQQQIFNNNHRHANRNINLVHNDSILYQVPAGHEYAQVVALGNGGNYYGANARINVWNPAIMGQDRSIAQVWVSGGPLDVINTMEAGWIVQEPENKLTRFFIYWTSDGYKKTGCYNLECSGFVQISKKVYFGAPINPISIYNGTQYDISVAIYKEKVSGHWWLDVQGEPMGYWPDTIFPYLKGGANYLNWGGEIIIAKPTVPPHTSTQMGSGHVAGESFGKASFIANLEYVDSSGNFLELPNLLVFASKPKCYDVILLKRRPNFGICFYFGGPGFSPICPD